MFTPKKEKSNTAKPIAGATLSVKESGLFIGAGVITGLLGLYLPYPQLTVLGMILVLLGAINFMFKIFHIRNKDMSGSDGGMNVTAKVIIMALEVGILAWIVFGPHA